MVQFSPHHFSFMLNDKHPLVWMDVQVNDEPVERVNFELFETSMPKATENFLRMVKGEATKADGTTFGFKGEKLFYGALNTALFGGDFENFDGTAGPSSFGGEPFREER